MNKSFSQGNQPWVLPGNGNATATSFVRTTNAVPLNLKTVQNQPMQFFTNNVQRMILMGANPAGSISGSLGVGTNLTGPLAKLHLSDFGTNSTFDAQGRMFRTDGLVSVQNNWSIWTGNSPATATQKFRISTMANSGDAEIGTVQSGLLHLITNNQRRIPILGNSVFPFNRTGFVEFNNQAPLFHLDINTQNPIDIGKRNTFDHRKSIYLIA